MVGEAFTPGIGVLFLGGLVAFLRQKQADAAENAGEERPRTPELEQ